MYTHYQEMVNDWDTALIDGTSIMSIDLLFEICEFQDDVQLDIFARDDAIKQFKNASSMEKSLYESLCHALPVPPEIMFLHNIKSTQGILRCFDRNVFIRILQSGTMLSIYCSNFQQIMDFFCIPNIMSNPSKSREGLLNLVKKCSLDGKFGVIMTLVRLLVSTYFIDSSSFSAVSRVVDHATIDHMLSDYKNELQRLNKPKRHGIVKFIDIRRLYGQMARLKALYLTRTIREPPVSIGHPLPTIVAKSVHVSSHEDDDEAEDEAETEEDPGHTTNSTHPDEDTLLADEDVFSFDSMLDF